MSGIERLQTPAAKEAFTETVERAKRGKAERDTPVRGKDYFKQRTFIPGEPVFIASSEYIGTARARMNHVDACLHYCSEQMDFKAKGAAIK